MKKLFSIYGILLLTAIIMFVGCEGDGTDSEKNGADYLAEHPYDSLDRPDLTGETGYALQIIPDEMIMPQGESFQLYVTGGTKPYGDWIVTIPDLGRVTSSGVYIADKTSTGTNIVSITDASGETVSMTVVVHK